MDWQPLIKIVDKHQSFVISSHVRPDADAIGSETALAEILEQMGKTVAIVNPSAMPGALRFLDPTQSIRLISTPEGKQAVEQAEIHLIVDTSAWAQLADVGVAMRAAQSRKIVIDHHVSSDHLNATEFKDTSCEATGSLIFDLARYVKTIISPLMATRLFAAIATDTGWFRFPATRGETYRIAGELLDHGAVPHDIYRQLYEQGSISRTRLTGRVLSRVVLECEGRFAHTFASQGDFQELNASPPDTEDLVNECLRIAGTRAAIIAVEMPNRMIKVSFRSRQGLDIAQVAEQFGGGGHRQAAGATLPGPLTEALTRVVAAVKQKIETEP